MQTTTIDLPTWAITVPPLLAEVHDTIATRQPGRRLTPAGQLSTGAQQPLVRIIGALLTDAEWRVTAGDRGVGMVIITIEQPGCVPLRATQVVGVDRLAHVAGSAKAFRLKRGTLVQVDGQTLVPHPTGRSVELFGVVDIHERNPIRAALNAAAGDDA